MEKARDLFAISPAEIEAIEIYRGAAEVPAEFSGSTAECGVVAVWLRTGASYARVDEEPLDTELPRVRLSGSASRTRISGSLSPEPGSVVHVGAQWRVWRGLTIGPRLEYGSYQLTSETTAELTRGLGSITFRLPAGSRSLTVVAAGIEPRAVIFPQWLIRPVIAGHVQYVGRTFQVDRVIQGRKTSFWSYGWGLGGSVALEMNLNSRLAVEGGVAFDWLSLGRYATLEAVACNGQLTPGGCNGLLWDRTASDWTALSFRLGMGYAFGL
jgi:hypothetical protein